MCMKNILIGLGLIVGLILLVQLAKHISGDNSEPLACTMEALLCPDGSGVGRQGPKCEFSACQGNGPYEGILEHSNDGFRLVMKSPQEVGEVNYVMPVEIKVTNALQDVIDTRVWVTGKFIKGNTFEIGQILPANNPDSNTVVLKVGQTDIANSVNITLNDIVQDSRCPVNANCIEAGAITVNVTLQSNTDKLTTNIASDDVPFKFDAYAISIIDIQPQFTSESNLNASDYVITFNVQQI